MQGSEQAQVPAFSILCTAYRTEALLPGAIASVLAQTRPDWELVVVDNGLSDEVAAVVAEHRGDPRVRLVRQPNRGIAGGVDAAAAVATGEYLTVLHSDDELLPEHCARVGAVLDADPGVAAVACDAVLHLADEGRDAPDTLLRSTGALHLARADRPVTLRDFARHQHLYSGCTVRRAVLARLGGYAGDDPGVEDLALWLRLLVDGHDVRVLPEPLARERISASSASRHPARQDAIDAAAESAIGRAATRVRSAGDGEALDGMLRALRAERARRHARVALRAGDVPTARRAAVRAVVERPTMRDAAVAAGLVVAPAAVRRLPGVRRRLADARCPGRGAPAGAAPQPPLAAPSAPSVSFLCSAYRTEAYLDDTIRSVLRQTRPDWELVVVDNGMSDEIARIVGAYGADPRVRLVRQPNRGIEGGVSAAAAVAEGRFLAVLHSDDQVEPQACERFAGVLDADRGIDAVACDATVFTDERELPLSFAAPAGGPLRAGLHRRVTLTEVIAGRNLYTTGAVRRAAWDDAGGYRSTTPLVADLGLWLRLLAAGRDVRVLPDRLGRYRLREDSTSRDPAGVEAFEADLERALVAAAEASGAPADLAALRRRLRRLHSLSDLRRARWAFLDCDDAAARAHAAAAWRSRPTPRTGAVLAGVVLAPGALRRAHPAKQRVAQAASRAASRATRVVRRRAA